MARDPQADEEKGRITLQAGGEFPLQREHLRDSRRPRRNKLLFL